jgi:hypothetical protein
MKKITLSILLSVYTLLSTAQQMYLTNINGDPVLTRSYTDVIGSAFLYDNWVEGSVFTLNRKNYIKINLKYDLVKDQPYFKQKDNENLFSFTEKIKSFTLLNNNNEENYISGFPAVDNFSEDSYYQVLGTGKDVYLLKKNVKSISESRPYNSSNIEKTFVDNKVYYLFKNGKMEKFKPSKKEFLALFPAQSDQINSYLKAENVDFKNDQDLGKLFNHIVGLN